MDLFWLLLVVVLLSVGAGMDDGQTDEEREECDRFLIEEGRKHRRRHK